MEGIAALQLRHRRLDGAIQPRGGQSIFEPEAPVQLRSTVQSSGRPEADQHTAEHDRQRQLRSYWLELTDREWREPADRQNQTGRDQRGDAATNEPAQRGLGQEQSRPWPKRHHQRPLAHSGGF